MHGFSKKKWEYKMKEKPKKWIENTRIINYNSKREDLEEEDQRQDAVTKWKEMKTASKLIDGWIPAK